MVKGKTRGVDGESVAGELTRETGRRGVRQGVMAGDLMQGMSVRVVEWLEKWRQRQKRKRRKRSKDGRKMDRKGRKRNGRV